MDPYMNSARFKGRVWWRGGCSLGRGLVIGVHVDREEPVFWVVVGVERCEV